MSRAKLLAERIRVAISEIIIETPTDPLSFTMSIGLAEAITSDNDIDDLLKRADEGLYKAKDQGRNRVIEG